MALRRRRSRKSHVELAPLWMPKHGSVVVDHASASPPMALDGYTTRSRVVASLIGTPLETAAGFATVLAIGVYFATLPSLSGVASLIKLGVWQVWSIGLALLLTVRVRSVSIGSVARYWLVGMLSVAFVAYVAGKPLLDVEGSDVWVIPILEEALKALPLVFAVIWGRRTWRHPGLVDMVILGFAVGSGYAFHAAGLWGASWTAGIGLDLGLLVPTLAEVDGRVIAGQGVWSGLIGLAIGLVALHRHRPLALVAAATLVALAVADHMSVADRGVLEPVRAVLVDGVVVVIVAVLALGVAVAVDVKRLVWTGRRDHLFPSDLSPNALDVESEPGVFEAMLIGRYRRLRFGVHTTVHSVSQQWPPLSESQPAPLAELAARARAAGINIGPGSSATGWASDPERPGGSRFVGIKGFTVYAVSDVNSTQETASTVSVASAQPVTGVRAEPGATAVLERAPLPPDAVEVDHDDEPADPNDEATVGQGGDGTDEEPTAAFSHALFEAADAEAEADDAGAADETDADESRDLVASDDEDRADHADDGEAPSDQPSGLFEPSSTSAAWMSVPAARPAATGSAALTRPDRFWLIVGASVTGLGALVAARLFTAGDPGPALTDLSVNLAGAPATPALITGVVGAIAATVALLRPATNHAVPAWELGPGDDPVPHRPSECEV